MVAASSSNTPLSAQPGLSGVQLAQLLLDKIASAHEYASRRSRRWSKLSSLTHLLALTASAGATVFLGFATLDGLAAWGFILSALVTTFAAIEPFFNWRARWVLAEEASANWYALEDAIVSYVASRKADKVEIERIQEFYAQYSAIWVDFSQRWVESRRSSGNHNA